MEKKTIIYNFGPDGRDACWAALTSSWTHFSKQQGLNTTQVSCDSSACSDVEAQFKDTTRNLNSWPVKLRGRPNKKKKQNILTMTTASLSPPPQPLPPSSPRALKRRSGVLQQRWASTNDQLSNSVEVVKQKISEPPKTDGPCNCSQPVNSELSGAIVKGNNNNNDDDFVDNDKNKYGATETIDFADRKQQQLMLCAADSGSWADVNKPVAVDAAEQPIERRNEDDHVSSEPHPPTPPAAVVERPIEHVLPNGDGDRDVPADLRMQTPFAVTENPTMTEVDASYREVVSPTFRPRLSLMTSTTDTDNPMAITVFSPSSSQSQPDGGKDCPVQPNSSMIVFSEKPLSKYEMKIKEIDNSIISYSKSFLSTVLFVVLLRVLF